MSEPVQSIVSVTIDQQTQTASKTGFGTPLVLARHTENTDLIRSYTDIAGAVSDGHIAGTVVHSMLSAIFAQNPRPALVKVGRLTASVTATFTITITDATEGDHIKLTVVGPDGTETAIDYTVLSAASTTTVATAVELLVEAVTGISSTSSGADITAVGGSGDWYGIYGLQGCTVLDATPDAAVDDGLSAIQAIDDDWYYILTSVKSASNVDDVAAWAQSSASPKMFIVSTADSRELTSGSSSAGVGFKLSDGGYTRAGAIYHSQPQQHADCAWVGKLAPMHDDSVLVWPSWDHKTLVGISPDGLTATQVGYLTANNMSRYVRIAGIASTISGTIADTAKHGNLGSGDFIDNMIGADWISARMAEEIFGDIHRVPKLPMDDSGLAVIGKDMRAVLSRATAKKILNPGSGDPDDDAYIAPPTVTVPLAASIPIADRAMRLVTGCSFDATFGGAGRRVKIQGRVGV